MGLSHTTLEEYYSINFSLAQHHKYSMSDIENMIPFEKDLYVSMLKNHLEEQRAELEKRR